MGAGASAALPIELDKATAKAAAGSRFDEAAFDNAAVSGTVSRDAFLAAGASAGTAMALDGEEAEEAVEPEIGETIEVQAELEEGQPPVWVKAKVTVVHSSGWFQATVPSNGRRQHWFTWRNGVEDAQGGAPTAQLQAPACDPIGAPAQSPSGAEEGAAVAAETEAAALEGMDDDTISDRVVPFEGMDDAIVDCIVPHMGISDRLALARTSRHLDELLRAQVLSHICGPSSSPKSRRGSGR